MKSAETASEKEKSKGAGRQEREVENGKHIKLTYTQNTETRTTTTMPADDERMAKKTKRNKTKTKGKAAATFEVKFSARRMREYVCGSVFFFVFLLVYENLLFPWRRASERARANKCSMRKETEREAPGNPHTHALRNIKTNIKINHKRDM